MNESPLLETFLADRVKHGRDPASLVLGLYFAWFALCVLFNMVVGGFAEQLFGESEYIIAVVMGYFAAQFAVHAIWSVLGPWNRLTRLLFCVFTSLVLFSSFLGAIAIHEGNQSDFWKTFRLWLLCLPLVMLAIQSPLWAARIWFGCRLAPRNDIGALPATRPTSLLDLMLGIAVVAMAFAAARMARPEEIPSAEFFLPLVLGASIAGVFSLFTTVPTVYATHRVGNATGALVGILALELLVYAAAIGIIGALGSPPPAEAYAYLATIFLSFFLFLTGPMLCSRWVGYRVVWKNQDKHATRME